MDHVIRIARATDPLVEEAERVCAALDEAPHGLAVLDERGRCLAANRRLADWGAGELGRVLGGAREILAGVERATGGVTTAVHLKELAGAPTSAGPWRLTIAPFPSKRNALGAIVTVESLAQEQRAAQTFRATERRLRVLVDSASDGIAAHRDGVLLYVNAAGAVMLGQEKAASLVGRRLRDFVHPRDREVVVRQLQDPEWMGTTRLRRVDLLRADGSSLTVEVTFTRASVDDELTTFLFLRETQDRPRAGLGGDGPLESLATLTASVAHDFNNLIASIRVSLEAARRASGAGATEALARAEEAASRATEITRQLLSDGRSSRLPTEPPVAAVNAVVGEAARLTMGMRGNVRIETDLGPDVEAARLVPSQLHQVAMNLLLNACDAVRAPNDVVRVATRRVSSVPPSRGSDATGTWLLLQVADSGVGMDAKTRERLFEPFYTTKPPGMGTGLGLSTVQAIVVRAGGIVDVVSAPGRGTTVGVYLPEAGAASAVPVNSAPSGDPRKVAEDDAGEAAGPRSSATVLVCDDEARLAQLTATLLEPYGYEVLTADTARAAFQLLDGSDVDVMLLDVSMKPTSGRQILERMARRGDDVTVILTSGYEREDIDDDLFEHRRVVGYLAKPYLVDDLVSLIRQALAPKALGSTA